MEKISVIIPVFNVEEYLSECIDSILEQSYSNLEILLVDDGSTDNSGDICDTYSMYDERIKVIHKENGGLSSARNAGLDIASGKYIGFVDSDDVVSKRMFHDLWLCLEKSHSQVAICNMCYNIKEFDISSDYEVKVMDPGKALGCLALGRPFGSHACNKLYKRVLFDEIRFPVGKTYEDLFTTYKIIEKANQIVFLKKSLYYYRPNPNGITKLGFRVSDMNMIQGNLELLEYMERHYRNNVKYVRMSIAKATVALLRKIATSDSVDDKYILILQKYLRMHILYLLRGPYRIDSKLFGVVAAINYRIAAAVYRIQEETH